VTPTSNEVGEFGTEERGGVRPNGETEWEKKGSSERKRGEELGPTEKPNGRRRR